MEYKKCNNCGTVIKVLKGGDSKMECCGEEFKTLIPNSIDASFEKHVPVFEILNNQIKVKVNHVMEEEHYIEWISIVSDTFESTVYFKPNQEPIAIFPYAENFEIYAYCNKHGLWKSSK